MKTCARRLALVSVLLGTVGVGETRAATPAPSVHLTRLTWPWAWGKTPLELHLIRLRFDAGERTGRAYLRVGEIAGQNLQAKLALASVDGDAGPTPAGRLVWSHAAAVTTNTHYAVDFCLPEGIGRYTLKAAVEADGVAGSSAIIEFQKRAHPAAIEPPARQSVGLQFSEAEGTTRTAGPWPVAVGVPLPRGALTSERNVRVVGPDGSEVPAQVETSFTWYRDAPDVKWALVQFQPVLKPGQGNYRVEFGSNVQRQTAAPAPELAARALELANRWVRDGAYLVRDDGTDFLARNDPTAKVDLEETGPLVATARIAGRFVSAQGQPLCRYESRLSVFRAQPAVRLYFTLVWTEYSDVVARDVGIRIPTGFPGETVELPGSNSYRLAPRESVVLLQDAWNHCRTAAKGKEGRLTTTLAEGQSAPGRLVLTGGGKRAAAFLRDMGRNVPSEIEAGTDGLVLHVWAGDQRPLSWKLKDVVTPLVRDYYGDKLGNSYLTGGPLNTNDASDKSPFGVAKTLEFWVLPPDSSGDPVAINGLVQEPLVMLADPQWTAATQVWGPWHAYDPARFGDFEESLELACDWLATLRPEYGDYDWFNHGDVHMGTLGTYVTNDPYAVLHEKYGFAFSIYRGWACSGYDWPTATWIQFARTGKRKYFVHSEANARHVMDIDTCHDDANPATDRTDWKHHRGEQYEYGAVHWTYGPIELTFYTHVDFLYYCYAMTGYRRAKDVLSEIAGCVGGYWRVQGNREVTNPPKVLCRLYEMTGDEQYLYMAHRFVQDNVEKHIATSELYVYPGLFSYCNLTGRPEAKDLLLHYANQTAPPEPAWDRLPAVGGDPFEAVAAAYWITGDPRYLQYVRSLMRTFADGIQREGVPALRGMMGSSLAVIELGPMLRGVPAFLSAVARDVDKVPSREASMTAVLPRASAESLKPYPGFQHLTRAYLLEERDQAFVIDNPYRRTYGETRGEVLMQVIAPSGKIATEKRVVSNLLRGDERLRLDVPADGETGRYEVRVLLNAPTGADLGNSFVRIRSSLGRVMYEALDEILALYGPGSLWFYVPEGTKRFTVAVPHFVGGGVVLRDPDDVRVAGLATKTARPGSWAAIDPLVVDVQPGKAGRWWHLSYGVRSWPPLPVRLLGIPAYVAVSETERFVVIDRQAK
jgi:hypothetical protein